MPVTDGPPFVFVPLSAAPPPRVISLPPSLLLSLLPSLPYLLSVPPPTHLLSLSSSSGSVRGEGAEKVINLESRA
jgi:hypothetical protein